MLILLLSIIIALIIVIFAVQNASSVPIQFLFWSAELPLVLVIFCSVLAGALLMFCLAVWRDLKSQIKKRSNKDIIVKPAVNTDNIPKTASEEKKDNTSAQSAVAKPADPVQCADQNKSE